MGEESISEKNSITIERLLQLRKSTKAISELIKNQLKNYLTTLTPLLRPKRLLGDYIESASKETVAGADKAFAELQELYAKSAAAKSFDIPRELKSPLAPITNTIELYAWEYTYETHKQGEKKLVTITSPLKWALTFTSGYSLSRLRQVLAGKEERRRDDVQQFVIRCCAMALLFKRSPGIIEILEGLRYNTSIEKSPDLGELPIVCISSSIPTQRPPDHLITESTELSGIPMFEEVVDVEALLNMPDPFKQKILGIINDHGER